MSHPDMQSFVAEFPDNKEAMDVLQDLMNSINDANMSYAQKLAKKLGVSDSVAMDITYLRGRSRWTQKLENRLINAARSGYPCPCVLQGEESEWLDENNF